MLLSQSHRTRHARRHPSTSRLARCYGRISNRCPAPAARARAYSGCTGTSASPAVAGLLTQP
eukprot:scaffold15834_cov66-Phaeocystis_antarctica.AAC.7